MLINIIGLILIIQNTQSIIIQLGKSNLVVEKESSYMNQISINKTNSYLIPTNINFTTTIANTIPTFGNYFDLFFYLTPSDLECY